MGPTEPAAGCCAFTETSLNTTFGRIVPYVRSWWAGDGGPAARGLGFSAGRRWQRVPSGRFPECRTGAGALAPDGQYRDCGAGRRDVLIAPSLYPDAAHE